MRVNQRHVQCTFTSKASAFLDTVGVTGAAAAVAGSLPFPSAVFVGAGASIVRTVTAAVLVVIVVEEDLAVELVTLADDAASAGFVPGELTATTVLDDPQPIVVLNSAEHYE